MDKLVNDIREDIIERLQDGEGDGVYISDLPHEFYNQYYYIVGIYNAKEFLKENFDMMQLTIENYNDSFGSVDVELLSDYERLATLVVYYVAENIINALVNEGIDGDLQVEVNIPAEELISSLEAINPYNIVADIRGDNVIW